MPRGERSMVPPAEVRTYYDRPILKKPTWKWYIPAYFWAGGLAAGSSMLAAGADAMGDAGLGRRARLTALASISFGAGCLVADLGRPGRFHHMLRVAKPSSPMSVGTWVLTAYGPVAGLAAVSDLVGWFPRTGRAATWAAAALAPAVASYTAVLLSDTAIPAWHDAYGTMPAVFVSSAAAAAGGAALLGAAAVGGDPSPVAARLAVSATLVEAVAVRAMELSLAPAVRAAYTSGPPHRLSRLAAGLGAAGVALVEAGRRGRRGRWWAGAGGAAIVLASAAERFAIVAAGTRSAEDPAATSGPQRARLAALPGAPR
jgi:formate-dependent nitrite reductase membrane component NrfD